MKDELIHTINEAYKELNDPNRQRTHKKLRSVIRVAKAKLAELELLELVRTALDGRTGTIRAHDIIAECIKVKPELRFKLNPTDIFIAMIKLGHKTTGDYELNREYKICNI